MPNRVTTKELHAEIKVIKENHLKHIHDCIHRLEDDIKDNRKMFNEKMDKMDNRLWWIMGLIVTTLIAIVAEGML